MLLVFQIFLAILFILLSIIKNFTVLDFYGLLFGNSWTTRGVLLQCGMVVLLRNIKSE